MNCRAKAVYFLLASALLIPATSFAQLPDCSAVGIPTHAALTTALQNVVSGSNGGFGFPMWATIVNRKGEVCMVTRSAGNGEEWPGSRVISAQKANTANAFSLPVFALSTANLYTAVQPGGSLFGLQESNPVNPAVAYAGDANNYGTTTDALVGQKIGGINVFGGGLALYNAERSADRRDWRERRLVLRRPRDRLEGPRRAEPRSRAGWRQRHYRSDQT